MSNFRSAAQSYLWKKLRCIPPSSPEAIVDAAGVRFKDFILDSVLGNGPADNYTRFLLLTAAPCDWRGAEWLFILTEGTTKDAVFKLLVEEFVFFSSPQHRPSSHRKNGQGLICTSRTLR